MEEFSEHFKSWLSGFIDGEACFNIYPQAKNRGFHIQFVLRLRLDELSIIKRIHKYLGGKYYFMTHYNSQSPLVHYCLTGAKNCLRLVKHLEKYPLQAKKKEDFEIWKEGIYSVIRKDHLNGRHNYILDLCKRLKKVRQYKKQLEIDLPSEIEDKQLYF